MKWDKETRKIAIIKIEQTVHWEKKSKGYYTKVIDKNIALIDSDFIGEQCTRKYNVQNADKEKFLEELIKELRGLM